MIKMEKTILKEVIGSLGDNFYHNISLYDVGGGFHTVVKLEDLHWVLKEADNKFMNKTELVNKIFKESAFIEHLTEKQQEELKNIIKE